MLPYATANPVAIGTITTLPKARDVPAIVLAAAIAKPVAIPTPAEPFTVSLTASVPDFWFLPYFIMFDIPYTPAAAAPVIVPIAKGVAAVNAGMPGTRVLRRGAFLR